MAEPACIPDRQWHYVGMPKTISPGEMTRWICERAGAIGFELCGVAPVVLESEKTGSPEHVSVTSDGGGGTFPELEHLPDWLARGYAGEMNYLCDPRRADPRLALEGARSLIVVALNYNSSPPYSTARLQGHANSANPNEQLKPNKFAGHEDVAGNEVAGEEKESPRGWISRYAWGDDYHSVVKDKLEALLAAMRAEFPEPFEARAYVDTGPIIERVAAKYAGLGWLAKNTCLINQQLGSWLFLGVIVTTLSLEPSLAPGEPPPPDLCGSCTRCLDACPTQAFAAPYVLDSRRCISYLTIELRGAIPEEFRSPMGDAVIGCDICQDVCPWNRKAPVTRLAAFGPRELNAVQNPLAQLFSEHSLQEGTSALHPTREISPTTDRLPTTSDASGMGEESSRSLFAPELEWLASLTQSEFSEIFRNSAVKRAKWRGVVRNSCVALGNSGAASDPDTYSRIGQLLERLASSEDSLIAEHARWALAQLRASRRVAASDGRGPMPA